MNVFILFSSLVPGCDNLALVGDGLCNDETNNADCNFDGGDCCVENANKNSCSTCACHVLETCAAGYHPLVGNGFCDNETTIAECEYDRGDCCSNPELASNGVCNDGMNIPECNYDGGDCCPHPNKVGDGICNDETNHLGCDYDDGDCCVNVNTAYCSECNCLVGGVITSPGFPGSYGNNINLTWLIQVQIGQTIEINFLHFDMFPYQDDCL